MEINIFSTKGKIFSSSDVISVILPTGKGEIGILENHSNLISVLKMGIIVIQSTGKLENIFCSGGTFIFQNNSLRVFADEADLPNTQVKDELLLSIKLAEEKKANSDINPRELLELEKRLIYEKFKLERV